MAFKVSGTTIVDDSRNLTNIVSGLSGGVAYSAKSGAGSYTGTAGNPNYYYNSNADFNIPEGVRRFEFNITDLKCVSTNTTSWNLVMKITTGSSAQQSGYSGWDHTNVNSNAIKNTDGITMWNKGDSYYHNYNFVFKRLTGSTTTTTNARWAIDFTGMAYTGNTGYPLAGQYIQTGLSGGHCHGVQFSLLGAAGGDPDYTFGVACNWYY